MNVKWTADQESVLERIRENALQQTKNYKRLYLAYKGQLARYKIPMIVLSSFNSVFAVGTGRYIPQHIISGVSCIISLFVGIIGSIQMYLQIEADMERCLISSKDYYNLAIDIYKVLTLEREHRVVDGKTYLDETYNTYVAITDKSIVNNRKYIDGLFSIPDLPNNTHLRSSITNLNLTTVVSTENFTDNTTSSVSSMGIDVD